jgi:mono/diheme cytochrome c family protein
MKQPSKCLATFAAIVAAAAARADAPKQPVDLPKELTPAFKTWAGKCSQCHNPERVYGQKYTDPKQIERLVARMARKTSTISKDDQKLIAAYITWHNKPKQ